MSQKPVSVKRKFLPNTPSRHGRPCRPDFSVLLSFLLFIAHLPFSIAGRDTLHLVQGLVLQMPRGTQETILQTNSVEASMALGMWKAPEEGDRIIQADGRSYEWKIIKADRYGWLETSTQSLSYIDVKLELEKDTLLILRMKGNEMVYINRVPRTGNTYCISDSHETWKKDWDFVTVPVELSRGTNEILFRVSTGRMKASLYPARSSCMVIPGDLTLPDLVALVPTNTFGAVTLVNTNRKPLPDLVISCTIEGEPASELKIPVIQSASLRKCAFRIVSNTLYSKGTLPALIKIFKVKDNRREVLDSLSFDLKVADWAENRSITFLSQVDGSIQYYSVNPPKDYVEGMLVAMFLCLHGASAEASDFSGLYHHKSRGMIVAPTNRRPYGYNWEHWGRLDALEVLAQATRKFNIDENRIYLLGYSMGGHGVWHLGSLYPDRFAAIAPSGGWISLWNYRKRNTGDTTGAEEYISRVTRATEITGLVENHRQHGVYILHGEEDRSVLIDQPGKMVQLLNETGHKDFRWHFQPGAGHWWDTPEDSGYSCLEWPPMFEYLQNRSRPPKDSILHIRFLTANPGISSRCEWLQIDAQIKQLGMSEADILYEPGQNRLSGKTQNVARMAVDTELLKDKEEIGIKLDKTREFKVQVNPVQPRLWLEKKNNKWMPGNDPAGKMKTAARYGTFSDVFRNRMLFVYGTTGSEDENRWAFGKARYDAESFWYHGNGSVEVIADSEFDTTLHCDRNIILYGNRSTNKAWNMLLGNCPVQVENGWVTLGNKRTSGDDKACLFIYPHPGSETALIGAISGTGIKGMRMLNRIPFLSQGSTLPDLTVMDLQEQGNIRIWVTGFFGLDWSWEMGEYFEME